MNTKITAIVDGSFPFGFSGSLPAPLEERCPIKLSHSHPLPLLVMAIILCFGISSSLHAQSAGNQQKKLESLLKRYPNADADKDGKLTIEEAKAYKAAHPELRQKRQKRQSDKDGKAGEQGGDEGVSETVLKLYEAREFKGVPYRLLKPIDLENSPNKKYPMILSLHGAGGTGTDNVRNLREQNNVLAEEALRRKHPCFVVVPQSIGFWRTPDMSPHYTDESIAKMPADWKDTVSRHKKRLQTPEGACLDRVYLLLDALAKEFPIDTDRVYVLGHSGGGFGTWTSVADQPNRFAAGLSSAGWLAPWFDANIVKDVPFWSFQGAKDKTSQVSQGNSTFERMKAIGANMKFTEVANIGHGVGGVAFRYTGDSKENTGVTKYASDRCDKTADVWDWLFSKKRTAK